MPKFSIEITETRKILVTFEAPTFEKAQEISEEFKTSNNIVEELLDSKDDWNHEKTYSFDGVNIKLIEETEHKTTSFFHGLNPDFDD